MNLHTWTYGAEHEWGDFPSRAELPAGCTHNPIDWTMVNSNGIANDPKAVVYGFGGEINTPPTRTVEEQVKILWKLKKALPEAVVNYRSNLHLHVRVPGLRERLDLLKKLQKYIHATMPIALPRIEPLPRPCALLDGIKTQEEFKGALRRWRRRRVSHQTLLTPERLKRQLTAKTTEQFFALEAPTSKSGKPLWHAQPRLCVNLRQLLQTDTVEFRHFPGTLDENLFRNSLRWCRDYLVAAFEDRPIAGLLSRYPTAMFPPFPPYNHEQERRYRATVHDGTLSREEIRKNIQVILKGKFK